MPSTVRMPLPSAAGALAQLMSDSFTGHSCIAVFEEEEQQHSRELDEVTDEPQDEVGLELSTRHVDDEEDPDLYGA